MIKKTTNIIMILLFLFILSCSTLALNSQWTQPYFNYESNGNIIIPASFEQQIYGSFDDGTATIERSDVIGNDVQILGVIYNNDLYLIHEVSGILYIFDKDYNTVSTLSLGGGVIDKEFSVVGGDGSFLNEQTGKLIVEDKEFYFCMGYDKNISGTHYLETSCYDGNTINVTSTSLISETTGVTCKGFNTATDNMWCYANLFNGTLIAQDMFNNNTLTIEWSAIGNKTQFYSLFPASEDAIWMPPYVLDNDNDGDMDIYIQLGYEEFGMFQNLETSLGYNNYFTGDGLLSLDGGSFGLNCPVSFLEADGITATKEFVYLNDDDLTVYGSNGNEKWKITLASIGFNCVQARDKRIAISDLDGDGTTEDILIICVDSGGGGDTHVVIDGKSGVEIADFDSGGDTHVLIHEHSRYPVSFIDGDNDGSNNELLTDRGLFEIDIDNDIYYTWLHVNDDFNRGQAIDVTGDNIVELIFTKTNNRTTYGTNVTNSLPTIEDLSGDTGSPICSGNTVNFELSVKDVDYDSVNCGVDCQGNGTIEWSDFDKNPLTDTTDIFVACTYGHDLIGEEFDLIFYCSDTAHPFSTQVSFTGIDYKVYNENASLCFDNGLGGILVNNDTAVFDGNAPDDIEENADLLLTAFGFGSETGRALVTIFFLLMIVFVLIKMKAPPIAYLGVIIPYFIVLAYYKILPVWVLILIVLALSVVGALSFSKIINLGTGDK